MRHTVQLSSLCLSEKTSCWYVVCTTSVCPQHWRSNTALCKGVSTSAKALSTMGMSHVLMPSTASPVWYSESLRDIAQMVLVFIHVSQENQVGTFNWSIFFFLASLLLGQKLCIWKDLAKTACCEALRLSQTVIKSWGKATAPTAGQMEKSSLLS